VLGSPAPDGSGQGDFVAKLKKNLGAEGAAADIWIDQGSKAVVAELAGTLRLSADNITADPARNWATRT
jgi:hypothetical protein